VTRAPDPRLDLHNLGPLSREDAAALLDSLPRDPLHVAEDDVVERRRGLTDRRDRHRGHSTLALIAFLIAGLILGALAHATLAASRPPVDVIPAAVAERGESNLQRATRPPRIVEPLLTASPVPRAVVEQPAGELAIITPRPVVLQAPTGYAGWHRDPSVSWFGPGFYGGRTACGQTLTEGLQGVAHKTLPCGTRVTFRNAAGVELTVPVVDRGPYVAGRQWDLTGAACLALDHCWTGPLDWRLR
jgi:hypothetical protein